VQAGEIEELLARGLHRLLRRSVERRAVVGHEHPPCHGLDE
jgi:hypothetical protein